MERLKFLRFINPVFKKGLNFTVRKGTKWVREASVGEFIWVEGWKGVGRIECFHVCRLVDIPKGVLNDEHDPACQTIEGLICALKRAYPEIESMDDEDIENLVVSCVGFRLYATY